jgi:hypothetical protein
VRCNEVTELSESRVTDSHILLVQLNVELNCLPGRVNIELNCLPDRWVSVY